jgi:hypothetical protein
MITGQKFFDNKTFYAVINESNIDQYVYQLAECKGILR